jgi:tRNA(Ile)-lysidine synthase
MHERFRKYILENKLFSECDRILLAVSGGIDSMVMAHLFLELKNEIGIAHCNFSLRGEESDGDEALVKKFARENKLPFYSIKFNTTEFAVEKGISIQMAARELRYSWFEKIKTENNYNSVSVAHNLNDNIETLLINLTRGTGIAGLSGIKPMSGNIIRPLLFATRKEIENYCRTERIEFREDSSNAETKYTRNKIRHKVIPLLKQINPSIETTLNETAERLSGVNDIINEYIGDLKNKIITSESGNQIIKINRLDKILNNNTILFELFRQFNINNNQLEDLKNVIFGKTGGVLLTPDHRILKNRKELIIAPLTNIKPDSHTIYAPDDLKFVPGIISVKKLKKSPSMKISPDPSIAYIDLDKLRFPLVIRKWKQGDYFHPLGMKQKKKLSDYFVDRKFSIMDKEEIRILESDGRIIWLIGERLDNNFKVTEETKQVLILTTKK